MHVNTGDVIRERRHALGLTQRELALQVKVSHAAIAQWEKGINRPSLSRLIDLSLVLGIRLLPPVSEKEENYYKGELISNFEEIALIRKWRNLDAEQRMMMLHFLAKISLSALCTSSTDNVRLQDVSGNPGVEEA